MKAHQFKFFLLMLPFVFSCGNTQSPSEFERLEMWENIRTAVKEKRIDYLIEISKDTLDCMECNEGNSKITKEEFFNSHLRQMEVSDTQPYSVFIEKYTKEKGFDQRYRVNYLFENGGESQNIIYTFLTNENNIQFQGVFGIP